MAPPPKNNACVAVGGAVRASAATPCHDARGLLLGVFLALLILRFINALTVQTFFQPDEYFQSLEPAWQLAFGSESKAWITWEWREHLRSSLHPWIFAKLYQVLQVVFRFTSTSANQHAFAEAIVLAPKLLQAVFAAVMDFCTYRLARRLYGSHSPAALATLALNVCSPWQWFASTRTLSNSLETTLTIVALDLWPWEWFLEQTTPIPTSSKVSAPGSNADLDKDKFTADLKQFLSTGESITSKKSQATEFPQSVSSASESTPAGLELALIFAALACILRPTNLIIWVAIALSLLGAYFGDASRSTTLAKSSIICGGAVLAVSTGVDRIYYGVWTFPPAKFLYFNLVQSLAVFYGHNRIDYYFTEGMPLLLTTAFPFALIGLWTSLRPAPDRPSFKGYVGRQARFVLAVAVLATLLVLSAVSHKEVRFIYPLLPILHIIAAQPMAGYFAPFPMPKSYLRLALLLFGFTINIYIAAYATLVHQRGVVDVMHYLRHECEVKQGASFAGRSVPVTVGFMMPCHSTPWRSHLVYPEIEAWALSCEPPLNMNTTERAQYLDEADIFYSYPSGWIGERMVGPKIIHTDETIRSAAAQAHAQARSQGTAEEQQLYASRKSWPQYLVFFEHLEPILNVVLENTKYEECWRGFNTHWHDDWRRQGDVVVWCMAD